MSPKLRGVTLSLLVCGLAACGNKIDKSPNVILNTDLGDIEIEVYPEKAPLSAGDFLNYVDRKFYQNQGFYRVVRADNDPRQMGMSLIQGGRLDTEPVGRPIAHESTKMTGLRNDAGSIAIAREEPGSGSAAFFFINIGNNNFLDHGGERNPDGQGYAVFGKVVSGMDLIKQIQAGEVVTASEDPRTQGQFLAKPVIINKAYRK